MDLCSPVSVLYINVRYFISDSVVFSITMGFELFECSLVICVKLLAVNFKITFVK